MTAQAPEQAEARAMAPQPPTRQPSSPPSTSQPANLERDARELRSELHSFDQETGKELKDIKDLLKRVLELLTPAREARSREGTPASVPYDHGGNGGDDDDDNDIPPPLTIASPPRAIPSLHISPPYSSLQEQIHISPASSHTQPLPPSLIISHTSPRPLSPPHSTFSPPTPTYPPVPEPILVALTFKYKEAMPPIEPTPPLPPFLYIPHHTFTEEELNLFKAVCADIETIVKQGALDSTPDMVQEPRSTTVPPPEPAAPPPPKRRRIKTMARKSVRPFWSHRPCIIKEEDIIFPTPMWVELSPQPTSDLPRSSPQMPRAEQDDPELERAQELMCTLNRVGEEME